MSYDDEIEDVLGPAKKPRNKGGRPKGGHLNRVHPPLKPPLRRAPATGAQPAAEIMGGVTVFWLAKAFGMEVSTVRKRVADCPPLARKTSGYLYSLPVAAQYLVNPKIDVRGYLDSMKPADLPQQLQAAYWEANLKRTKFESMMKQLWVSEDVMEVFAEVFKAIKFNIQLWPDTLERQTNFSDEDRQVLVRLADDLQDEIYKAIERLSAERSTPNALQRFYEALDQVGDDEDIM